MKSYALEIQAEGFPRYVGTFSFRFQAEDWAKANIANGSWNIVVFVHPGVISDVTGL